LCAKKKEKKETKKRANTAVTNIGQYVWTCVIIIIIIIIVQRKEDKVIALLQDTLRGQEKWRVCGVGAGTDVINNRKHSRSNY